MKVRLTRMKLEQTFLFRSILFWLTAFSVPVRLKLTSQKVVLAKISNKAPFLKVDAMGTYLRGGAYLYFSRSCEGALFRGFTVVVFLNKFLSFFRERCLIKQKVKLFCLYNYQLRQ